MDYSPFAAIPYKGAVDRVALPQSSLATTVSTIGTVGAEQKKLPSPSRFSLSPASVSRNDFAASASKSHIVYKIGDLGHVTRTGEKEVEEGDTRYLAKELLNEDYSNLTKADILSTGLMLHELASCTSLPQNGPDWHKLRDGNPPHLPR
jgi:hypothetical protein